MTRVAFIMDRAFRRFGLSGKSFIPFMISSGCGVPGIMATRTIENEKDRRMTMITTTVMHCPDRGILNGRLLVDGTSDLLYGSIAYCCVLHHSKENKGIFR